MIFGLYGNNHSLEYDVIVKPGADPSQVQVEFSGIGGYEILKNGDLLLRTPQGGELVQKAPFIYQRINGRRIPRDGELTVLAEEGSVLDWEGNHAEGGQTLMLGFRLGSYDKDRPLIIDPVLNYSTYLGGSHDEHGSGGIAIDGSGNAYIIADTFSTNFPVVNAIDDAYVTGDTGSTDFPTTDNPIGPHGVFVSKFNTGGTVLEYSTP